MYLCVVPHKRPLLRPPHLCMHIPPPLSQTTLNKLKDLSLDSGSFLPRLGDAPRKVYEGGTGSFGECTYELLSLEHNIIRDIGRTYDAKHQMKWVIHPLYFKNYSLLPKCENLAAYVIQQTKCRFTQIVPSKAHFFKKVQILKL